MSASYVRLEVTTGKYDWIIVEYRKQHFNRHNSLVDNLPMQLQSKIKHILNGQASTTGIEDLDHLSDFSANCPLTVNTIATSFTFLADMGKAKSLIRSNRFLEHSLLYAKQTKAQFFFVYIPIFHLYLADSSGFLLPVKQWDPLNFGCFLLPGSTNLFNPRPSTCVGDVFFF
mmetsp:Transcript_33335/g.33842  ORF Transcript_33335/g.33842 Transcript_33335/m.33842 type:complete len:172 (-) Transcript_33335:534-1049(-)